MTENQSLAAQLTTRGKPGNWWIDGLGERIGPYATKAEADEDRAGLQRFLRHGHKRGYITNEKTAPLTD